MKDPLSTADLAHELREVGLLFAEEEQAALAEADTLPRTHRPRQSSPREVARWEIGKKYSAVRHERRIALVLETLEPLAGEQLELIDRWATLVGRGVLPTTEGFYGMQYPGNPYRKWEGHWERPRGLFPSFLWDRESLGECQIGIFGLLFEAAIELGWSSVTRTTRSTPSGYSHGSEEDHPEWAQYHSGRWWIVYETTTKFWEIFGAHPEDLVDHLRKIEEVGQWVDFLAGGGFERMLAERRLRELGY